MTSRPRGHSLPAGRAISSASSAVPPTTRTAPAGRTRGERRRLASIRPRERSRDVADPRLLWRPLGVRAAHLPDPVEPRRRRRGELRAGLLPRGSRPVPRDDDAPPEARAQEEPQAPPPARALPGHPDQVVLRPRL